MPESYKLGTRPRGKDKKLDQLLDRLSRRRRNEHPYSYRRHPKKQIYDSGRLRHCSRQHPHPRIPRIPPQSPHPSPSRLQMILGEAQNYLK